MSIDETLPADSSGRSPVEEAPHFGGLSGYQLLELIGQGGMGEVYRAVDLRLGREVAVKLLRPEYCEVSRALDRFRFEARITGRLQHPGIPAVHELGCLPDGRPFLAMKLVRGRTLQQLLTERADAGHERGKFLAIFEQVCQAVGYAHAQRIIHRDLKPSNVMVGAFGEVQVMDWGIAKQLDVGTPWDHGESSSARLVRAHEDTQWTPVAVTQVGSVLGTPSYMAPEQARGEIDRLGPYSDVFALGAIFCQILTGEPPVTGSSAEQVRRQVAAGQLAAAYEKLERCAADPEWIDLCKRCLAVNPEDRPADGASVAEAVAAIRQAAEERAHRAELARAQAVVREIEQRKRRRVWIGLAVSLLVGLVIATGLGIRSELLRREAVKARQAEAEALHQAQKRLAQIEKGNQIITAIFADLDLNRVRQSGEPLEAALAGRLRTAASQLEGEAVGDPVTVAALQHRLAQSLLSLGYANDAAALFEKAYGTRHAQLGEDHSDTLETARFLGMAHTQAGRVEQGLAILERTLKQSQELLGQTHPATLKVMNDLALSYSQAGRVAEAIPLLEECYRLTVDRYGIDYSESFFTLSNLATAHMSEGLAELAIPLLEDYVDRVDDMLGKDHPYTLGAMSNLGQAYLLLGDASRAVQILDEVVRRRRSTLGRQHPDTVQGLVKLASACWAAGQMERAVDVYRETAEILQADRFRPAFATQAMYQFITALRALGLATEAESWCRKWLESVFEQYGPASALSADVTELLGDMLYEQQKYADALALYQRAWQVRQSSEKDVARLQTLVGLISVHLALQQQQHAEVWADQFVQEALTLHEELSDENRRVVRHLIDELKSRLEKLQQVDWFAPRLQQLESKITSP